MQLTVLKFGSKTCPACKSMDRAGVLEKLLKEQNVQVFAIDISDERGETPEGTAYEKAYEMSDTYEVTALPTIIVETPDGGELIRFEGACNLKTLVELVRDAESRIASRNLEAVGARKL